MRCRDATPGNEELFAIDRHERAIGYLVTLARRQPVRRRPAPSRIVQIDWIGAARNRVVELARLQNVLARERVPADYPSRLADADLRAGSGDARIFEARHELSKELPKLHGLQTRFHLGAGQVFGVERIDVDDARHVDGNLVGIGGDEKRDELARHVDEPLIARALPKAVESGNRGE